ncbi:ZIP family metal transporter [Sulfolobus sp. S-194]|uniref:ZIP family metal transporter n=1 Tax=Sulfolobus sp. S-194 TaxID=2512240 RepID=UPI0014371A75|nr:ZIP family metal transporter [Sulfolobus sp. S-194]QIW22714.1 ZIP family metal transporter [Sulfolobus sp. S-194]
MFNLFPIILGFIAGSTVAFGSIIVTARKFGKTKLGYLAAFTGGILSYLALDTGSGAEEIVNNFLISNEYKSFLVSLIITSIGFLATWISLSLFERNDQSLVVSMGLGFHNIGEGFAIAAALLAGSISSAWAFTIGFAVHNMTEGFAISTPSFINRNKVSIIRLIILSLIAGLPTALGASIYYLGISNQIFLALLDVVASASLVYVMVKINISAASLLGGFKTKFWTWIFIGVAITYGLESLLTFLGMT